MHLQTETNVRAVVIHKWDCWRQGWSWIIIKVEQFTDEAILMKSCYCRCSEKAILLHGVHEEALYYSYSKYLLAYIYSEKSTWNLEILLEILKSCLKSLKSYWKFWNLTWNLEILLEISKSCLKSRNLSRIQKSSVKYRDFEISYAFLDVASPSTGTMAAIVHAIEYQWGCCCQAGCTMNASKLCISALPECCGAHIDLFQVHTLYTARAAHLFASPVY